MPETAQATASGGRSTEEFPAPSFPSGVAVAPMVLLVALLLGATSLVVLRTPPTDAVAQPGRPGVVAGITMAVVAMSAFAVLQLMVVRPVKRLRCDLAVTSIGGVRRSRISECDRIATALHARRPRARHGMPGARRLRVSLRAGSTVLTVALVGCLGATFTMVSGGESTDAAVLVADSRHDVANSAADLRHGLQEGLSGVQAIAATSPSTRAGDLRSAAESALAARPIFRSVHVVDGTGAEVLSVGDGHILDGFAPGAGITQLNVSGPEPIVVATAPIGGSAYLLVAEYDIRAVNALLKRSQAPSRVIDVGYRTVLSNEGYQAFVELSDPILREAVATARDLGPTATAQLIDGAPSAVATYPVGFSDAAADLGWVVLQDQSLAAADFARDDIARTTAVIIGFGVGIALAVMVWVHIATVRPLRRLADHAESIAAWRNGGPTAEPVAPERIDEVGAIAMELNRLLIAATRSTVEQTQVLPRIRPPRPTDDTSTSSFHGSRPGSGPRTLPAARRPRHPSPGPDVDPREDTPKSRPVKVEVGSS